LSFEEGVGSFFDVHGLLRVTFSLSSWCSIVLGVRKSTIEGGLFEENDIRGPDLQTNGLLAIPKAGNQDR
jgi:hypothetical protein